MVSIAALHPKGARSPAIPHVCCRGIIVGGGSNEFPSPSTIGSAVWSTIFWFSLLLLRAAPRDQGGLWPCLWWARVLFGAGVNFITGDVSSRSKFASISLEKVGNPLIVPTVVQAREGGPFLSPGTGALFTADWMQNPAKYRLSRFT